MFFSFIAISHSVLKPVIFLPGTLGSILEGSINRYDHWYCPVLKDKTIYINSVYLTPPLYNCLIEGLRLTYDENTNYYKNIDGVTLNPKDWGGIQGFQFGKIFPDLNGITYYGEFINYLKENGYTVGKNIFGAPYDWRLGPNMPSSFWTQLSALVEKAYNTNSNTKVVLVGHSLGGFMVQRYLTQHTTAEWRSTYIDFAILSAPSFGGSGLAVTALFTGSLPRLAKILSNATIPAVRSLGALHAQLPNHEIFGDQIISYDKNGNPLKASDLPNKLLELGYVEPKIFALGKDEPVHAPEAPDVPTVVIYNSAIETVIGYNAKTEEQVFDRGDNVVLADGPEYACQNWKKAQVVCHDFNKNDKNYGHVTMLMMHESVQLHMNYILDDSWKNNK